MGQATNKTASGYPSPLRVIKQTASALSNEIHLANTAWNFAYTALWNDIQFSSKETEQAKTQIALLLQNGNGEKAFISFCERVLLARQYINKTPGRYLPLPTVWLDSSNKLGYAGTQRWHDSVKAIRESIPGYKTQIKALAEAILEISTDPSAGNYRYWKTWFIDHRAPGLLQLFQAAAIQQLYH